jgi:outer membrane protein assembly factor BamB
MPDTLDFIDGPQGIATETDFVFVSAKGTLQSVDRSTGAIRWSSLGIRSRPENVVKSGETVVFPGHTTVGLDARDGARRWMLDTHVQLGDCHASADAQVVVLCTLDWNVTAFESETGAQRWTVNLRDSLAGLPTLMATVISGDRVYAAVKQIYSTTVGFAQALIFALSLKDGSILSLMRVGDYTDFLGYVGAPSVVGRVLVVPHLITNRITGIDRFTGRIVWRLNGDPGWVGFLRFPTVIDGIVYAASGDRRVYAVDAASGAVKWKSDILEGSQYIAVACGSVIITWSGVNLRILDRATGRYLGIIDDDVTDFSTSFTAEPITNGNELLARSQKEYRKYICP